MNSGVRRQSEAATPLWIASACCRSNAPSNRRTPKLRDNVPSLSEDRSITCRSALLKIVKVSTGRRRFDRKPNPLTAGGLTLFLGFLPELFEVFDRGFIKGNVLLAQFLFNISEPLAELTVTQFQCCFRLDIQAARDVRNYKK